MQSFEEKLERLEELSEQIKQGELSLDQAVSLFEEGIKLAKTLEKELAKVERKVEILLNNPTEQADKPTLDLFPELDQEN